MKKQLKIEIKYQKVLFIAVLNYISKKFERFITKKRQFLATKTKFKCQLNIEISINIFKLVFPILNL